MPKKGYRQKICKRGHDNWMTDNRGERRCQTCVNENKGHRRRREGTLARGSGWSDPERLGDRGPRDETFSYTEIMKARGLL